MTSETKIWYSGKNNFKKHIFTRNENLEHEYSVEFLDTETQEDRHIFDILVDHVSSRQTKFVEMLFSGGMDSELSLRALHTRNVPVRAMTMRIKVDGLIANTHDLYYATKFCREYGIPQKYIDLDATKFFENGDHVRYLEPYLIPISHVSTHFWLFEQCTGYPVIGGDYMWPWTHANSRVISPLRYEYSQYDRFLSDRGIDGVGSMLGHSLDSQLKLAKEHIKLMSTDTQNQYGGEGIKIARFKHDLYEVLGHTDADMRLRNFGWESIDPAVLNQKKHTAKLQEKYGTFHNTITWNQKIADVLGTVPGSNNLFK